MKSNTNAGPAPDPGATLVIVGGAPGSGKTTLARSIAAELRLPLVARDELKEVLYDTIGAPDRAASIQLGMASFRLILHIASRLLDVPAGVRGLVLESNFRHGLSEPDLAPLAARARSVVLHCRGDPDVIVRRYRERAERGERHPSHHDLDVVEELRAALVSGEYEPLDLGVPTLQVDTTAGAGEYGYAPSLTSVVAFIHASAGHRSIDRPVAPHSPPA